MRHPISAASVVPYVALSLLLAVAPARAQEGSAAPSQQTATSQEATSTVAVEVPGAGLRIEVPTAWRPGIMRGAGTVLHYIGSGDGFPHFSVQTDPDARLTDEATEIMEREAIEGLFTAIVEATGAEIVRADWVEINGLTVHSSLTRRESVTGPLQMRRILMLADRTPFVFVWGQREANYASVESIIERCAGSLHPSN